MSQPIKIIWPIDPTQSHEKADENIHQFLTLLSQQTEFELQPVSVVSADFFVTSEYFEPVDVKALISYVEKECEVYLKTFKSFNPKPVKILENHFSSHGAQVMILSDYVKQTGADFALISSHGRKGWTRLLVGSFAESFLLQSTVPVFVIGPDYRQPQGLSNALMPVELGVTSQDFIEKFLDHHSLSFLKSITLFHKISMLDLEDIAWAPTLYGIGGYQSDDILKKAHSNTEKFLSSFMDHPLSQKRLKYEISKSLDSIHEVLIAESKKSDVHMIILRSQAGPVAARFLGSVAREVIRSSQVPTLVYPHHYKI